MKEALLQSTHPEHLRAIIKDVDSHIQRLNALKRGHGKPGSVPQDVFWLVDGQRYIGEIHIRHHPSGRHPSIASHLYYEVRPAERGRGYGTELLRLGLGKAHAIGHRSIIASCDASNTASRHIIETNGGRLIARRRVPGERSITLLYRMPTNDNDSAQKENEPNRRLSS